MNAIIAIQLISIASGWIAVCFPVKRGAELKDLLANTDREVLAACIVVLTALLPALRYAGACRIAHPAMASAILGFESACCAAATLARGRDRDRILRRWFSSKLASAVATHDRFN